MKKKSALADSAGNNSFKTLAIFGLFVILLVVISLSTKAYLIIKASRYDGTHNFVLALAEKNIVKEIISFDPQNAAIDVMKLTGTSKQQLSSLGKDLGIAADGNINIKSGLPLSDNMPDVFYMLITNYNHIKADITIYDLGRLLMFARSASRNNIRLKEVPMPMDSAQLDKIISAILTDNVLSQEGLSIQVVNGAGVTGIGKRLERVIDNIGGNVIAVSTASSIEPVSKIYYFGKESYTLDKLESILKFTAEYSDKKTIADMVIMIGKDSSNTKRF